VPSAAILSDELSYNRVLGMKKLIYSLSVAVSISLIGGCEETFNTKAPYKDQMVVYAILSLNTDTQYVRLFTTYNPPGFDPLENSVDNMIDDAVVTVSQDGLVVGYRDTVITRIDKSRYKDDLRAYVAFPFRVQPGKLYNLNIMSLKHGVATGSLTMPVRGRISVFNIYVLKGGGDENEDLIGVGWIRYGTRGFMIRLYLDYDALDGSVWVNHRVEMPTSVSLWSDTLKKYDFPRLQRCSDPPLDRSEVPERVYFSKRAYDLRMNDIKAQYPADGLRIKGAWFILTQVEKNLYTYFSVANAFQDEYSIRLDMPDWTNIHGGYGVFGGKVEDSLYVDFSKF
jgi:hypothetical protein